MRRSPLAVVYLTVFLDIFGFGIVLPSLPFFVIDKVGEHGAWIGALVASYSLAQFIGAPILGRTSDRIGRRPVLIFSLLGSALALAATAFADSLWTLLVARALGGLFAGSISTAQAYIADVTTQENRAKYMGLLGASIGTGFVFGPFAGSLLVQYGSYGFQGAALLASGLSLLNMVLAAFTLSESLPTGTGSTVARARLSWGALRGAIKRPGVGFVLASSSLCMLGFVAMETTFPLLGKQNVGLGPAELGRVFGFVGIVMIVVQGGLTGPLTRRFGERMLSILGCLAMGIALLLMPGARDFSALMMSVGVLALGSGLSTPAMSTLLSRITSQDDQGGVMGINQSLGALSRAIGPVFAGALYDLDPMATYGSAALLMLVSMALLKPVHQPESLASEALDSAGAAP
jgi:DHA1 family tetracycline resistance protein-like MFS transporter